MKLCSSDNHCTTAPQSAWKIFQSVLSVLTNNGIAIKGNMLAMLSVLFYARKTWAVKVDDANRLISNDNIVIRWICSA